MIVSQTTVKIALRIRKRAMHTRKKDKPWLTVANGSCISSICMTEVDFDGVTDHGKKCPKYLQKIYVYAQKN